MKRQRVELEVWEEVERVEREREEVQRRNERFDRIAAEIDRLFTDEVADRLSGSSLKRIVSIIAASQERRIDSSTSTSSA